MLCKNCGKNIGSKTLCPHCNFVNPTPKWYERSGMAILLLILFFPVGLFVMWKYQKWNIAAKIVVSVFFAIVLIVMAGNQNNVPTSNLGTQNPITNNDTVDNTKPTDYSIKAGMYKVGTDLDAGEYVIIADSAYVEVTSDSTGTLASIITNDNFNNRTIVTVSAGQYLSVSAGQIYPFDKAPKVIVVNNRLPDGKYKVGVDLPAGEYKITSSASGYVEVAKDSKGILSSIVSNDNFDGDKYITVKAGQYIKLSRAELILK